VWRCKGGGRVTDAHEEGTIPITPLKKIPFFFPLWDFVVSALLGGDRSKSMCCNVRTRMVHYDQGGGTEVDDKAHVDFWNMVGELGGTEAYNSVLFAILHEKRPMGNDIPGITRVSYRDLAKLVDVSLGTVGRALTFWQSVGVIVVHPSQSRQEPTTIEYLGLPQLILEHPMGPILKELKDLIQTAEGLTRSLKVVENKIDRIIRDTQRNELSIFRKSKPVTFGKTDDGRTLYVLEGE